MHVTTIVNPILRAARFAEKAHRSQKRRYSGDPYITHPMRVAGRVMAFPQEKIEHHRLTADDLETLVVVALLHDVLEDTPIQATTIERRFGEQVARMVSELTNPTRDRVSGTRAERKAKDRQHLAVACKHSKVIKLVDRIDNLRELDHVYCAGLVRKKYLEMYSGESLLLAGVLSGIDEELEEELRGLAIYLKVLAQKNSA